MGAVSLTTSEYNELLRKADMLDRIVTVEKRWSDDPELRVNLKPIKDIVIKAFEMSPFAKTHIIIPEDISYASCNDFFGERETGEENA